MDNRELTPEQADLLGEVANITTAHSAMNLGLMVNRRVEISTPCVEVVNRKEALDSLTDQSIFVHIQYVVGLTGNNVFVLQKPDVLCMTDLMMGGDGSNREGEMTELHVSAVSESMNQMMGAAATSMSTMLGIPVDISTPHVVEVDGNRPAAFEEMCQTGVGTFVRITFRMQIADLISAQMAQVYPLELAEGMYKVLSHTLEKIAEQKAAIMQGR